MDIVKLINEASSPADVELLLRAMGQSTMPNREAPPPNTDPIWQAQGQFFSQDMRNLNSPTAAQALLNSMGQTGVYSEKIPMSPETSAGLNSPAPVDPGFLGAPTSNITPEERAWIDKGYALGNQGVEEINARLVVEQLMQEDAKFRDMPYTGVANTKGGAARVNQYTKDHGVIATMDEKGRVTLTNLDPATGKPTPQSQKQIYGFNPMNATTSGNVNELITQIRGAKTREDALSIASSLRTAATSETLRLEQEALKYAENEVGLPALKARLTAAEALDQATPGWQPGFGDSKNTAALRQAVYAAQQQAGPRAKSWLDRNISYRQLQTSIANAEAELSVADKRFATQEGLNARSAERVEQANLMREAKDMELYDSLSLQQKAVVGRLMPKEEAADPIKAARYFSRQARTDKNFAELVQTDPADVPKLALSGNPLARNIIIEDEAARTGQDPAVIAEKMKQARVIAETPAALEKYARIMVQGQPNATQEARKMVGELTALKNGNKEQQAAYKQRIQDVAYTLYKEGRNTEFAGNVGTWGDSELQPFVQQSLNTTGKADITNVLTAYLGDKTGPQAIAAAQAFKQKAIAAASKYRDSPYGPLNTLAISAEIDREMAARGTIGRFFQEAMKAPGTDLILLPFDLGRWAASDK